MFIAADKKPEPIDQPRLPAMEPTGFGAGLSAAWTAERLETNSFNQYGQIERDVYKDLRSQIESEIGPEETARRINEYAPTRDPSGYPNRKKGISQVAKELGIAGSSAEEAAAEAQKRYRAEYDDAVETLDFMRGGRGVTEFLGRGGAGVTDPVSLGMGAVSGGTGTVARIFLREMALGAAGEAAILPRQFDMAERLDIPDPNIPAQIGMGALFAGGLYGGGKVLTGRGRTQIANEMVRATHYAQQRLGKVPSNAGVGPDQARSIVDQAEAALEAGETPDPAPAPVTVNTEPVIVPRAPDIEVVDEVEKILVQSIADIKKNSPSGKQPLVTSILRSGGIDPDGPAAGELKNRGVTNKLRPGLFKRGGATDLDNLPASEWENNFPGLSRVTGIADDELYLDPDGLYEALARELNGERIETDLNMELQRLESDLELHRRAQEELRENIQPIPDSNDPVALKEEINHIHDKIDRTLHLVGLQDKITDTQRGEMAEYLATNGGTVEAMLDGIDEGDLRFAEADLEAPYERPQTPLDAYDTANAEQLDPRTDGFAGSDKNPRPEGGGATGGGPADGPDGQTGLIAQASNAEFTEGAHGDDMVARAATSDMREFIESDGDFDVLVPDDQGNMRSVSAAQIIADIEADQEFVEIAELCGRPT